MGLKVALIEDNPADAFLLEEALSQLAPCECVVINHGDRAMEFLRGLAADAKAALPELIVLDLNLPGRGGVDLLTFIRSTAAIRTIPVAVVSSHPKEVQAKKVAQADCYLQKPSNLEDFLALGRELLRHAAHAENPPASPDGKDQHSGE